MTLTEAPTHTAHHTTTAPAAPLTGAQWIVHRLRELGVDTVHGYPGGAIMPLYDALHDGGLRHILTRHEQGAAIAAIGHARSTGQVGVCIATSGPGATNLITGLADALLDSVPIVAITGQVASPLIGTDAFQEVDVLGLSLACTKHSYLVRDVADLPRVLDAAFRLARSGRPGPVLIDIAKDAQLATLDAATLDAATRASSSTTTTCRPRLPTPSPPLATSSPRRGARCCTWAAGWWPRGRRRSCAPSRGRPASRPPPPPRPSAQWTPATRTTSACSACTGPRRRTCWCRSATC